MNPGYPTKDQLVNQIVARRGDDARYLASRMTAEDVGAALVETARQPKNSVRILTLELAAEYPSIGTSRAILHLLFDSDPAIRSVAGGMIGRCLQRSVAPELIETMKKELPLDIKCALARQAGFIGGPETLPPLEEIYERTSDPDYRRNLSLAMARLGRVKHKDEAVRRLANIDAGSRVQALRDLEYIGDKALVRNFGEVLKDLRDVLDISPPHEFPVVWVRVCDVAVQSMAILGVPLSFGGLTLHRWDDRQLAEAALVVRAMQQ